MTQLVFIDTETSGLDPERHEVWEIGCIVRGSTDESSNGEWLWQLKPDLAAADPTGLRVGRYYEREQLWRWGSSAIILASPWWNAEKRSVPYPAEATSRSEVAERLAKLLGGAHLVGAVPSFDAAFLTRFLRRHGQAFTAHYHLVDVEALAAGWIAGRRAEVFATEFAGQERDDRLGALADILGQVDPSPPWDSGNLSRAVGVAPEDFERHTAIGDARWAKAIYDAVMNGGTA